AGVNAILADLEYVPKRGFSAPDGVTLNASSWLYSGIGVNIESVHGSLSVKVAEPDSAPQAVDDFFSVRTSLESTLLDVLGNDQSGIADGTMEIVDSHLGGHSQASLTIDPQTQQLVYQPPVGFMGTDVIAYTVRNAAGVEAQGRVEVNVMPPILAILSTTQNSTNLEVINAETMGQISQFEVFSRVAADSIVEVADLDNDGFMEIVVLQTGGERRMRSFNAWGGMLTDTAMQPFGSRFSGPLDLSIGDLDDDGKAELVVAASTPRSYEIKAV
ncbi:MAG: FG-GAP-like repeat-containing protein, partial [Planctomycetaceae bacterium]